MSELLQRFKERFQMWHEERLGGPSGAPAGGSTTPQRNPLSWGVVVAIILLLPPYRFRDFVDMLLPLSALVFLGFYFARSRFAWHALAVQAFIILPLYVLLSFTWRFHRAMHPWTIWVPIIGTILLAASLFSSRRRYFSYLEQRKSGHVDERI